MTLRATSKLAPLFPQQRRLGHPRRHHLHPSSLPLLLGLSRQAGRQIGSKPRPEVHAEHQYLVVRYRGEFESADVDPIQRLTFESILGADTSSYLLVHRESSFGALQTRITSSLIVVREPCRNTGRISMASTLAWSPCCEFEEAVWG